MKFAKLVCLFFLSAMTFLLAPSSQAQIYECEAISLESQCTPTQPTFKSMTLVGSTLNLSWITPSSPDYFLLTQSTNGVWGRDTVHHDSGVQRVLSSGNSYIFRITACSDRHGCSPTTYSSVLTIPNIVAPGKPSLSLSSRQVTVNWNSVSLATYFEIQQQTNGSWGIIVNKGTNRTHTLTGNVGSTYRFRVRACEPSKCSSYSTVSDPINVLATVATPNISINERQISVNWGAVANATRYDIQQQVNGTWGSVINNGSSRAYSMTGNIGSAYTFRVRACHSLGCASYSNVAASVFVLAAPTKPSFTITNQQISVNWSAVANATRYEFQQETNGSWGSVINKSTSRSHSINGLVGNTYRFRVRACSTSSCGAFSPVGNSIQIRQVERPIITPPGGAYDALQLVSISSATSGAIIRYTTDGTAVNTNSTEYRGPIVVGAGTIRAKAFLTADGWVNSAERQGIFTLSGNDEDTVIYIHTDILGSVIGETDQDGKLIRAIEYKPFGKRKEQ